MSKKRRRVIRGGSYLGGTGILRSTYRFRFVPEDRLRLVGFRIVVKRRKP